MGEAVGCGEQGRDRPDIPDFVLGQAGFSRSGDVRVAEHLGSAGQREGEINDRTPSLVEFCPPGIDGHAIGQLRIPGPDPQDRPVSHHAVGAVIGAGRGDDHQLPFRLAQAVLAVHQRVVVVEKRPQFGRPVTERTEDVRHETGFLRYHADPLAQVVGKLFQFSNREPAVSHVVSLAAAW